MKVKDVMTQSAVCCSTETNVGAAVELLWELTVGEIATTNVVACKPEDEIHEALQTMAEKQVRRLPVVNNEGIPEGILSIEDFIITETWVSGKVAASSRPKKSSAH